MFPSLEQKLKGQCQVLPKRLGFLDPLALALSCCKKLKVIRAQMPALWNSFLLDVSANPSVERIELLDGSEDRHPFPPSTPSSRPRSRGMSDVAPSPSSPFPLSASSSPSAFSHARFGDERKMNEKVSSCKIELFSDVPAIADFDAPPAPSSLFMQQAAKHPRLQSLILVGRRHMFLQGMHRHGLRGSSRKPPTQPRHAGSASSPSISSRSRAHSALPATPTSMVMARGSQSTKN